MVLNGILPIDQLRDHVAPTTIVSFSILLVLYWVETCFTKGTWIESFLLYHHLLPCQKQNKIGELCNTTYYRVLLITNQLVLKIKTFTHENYSTVKFASYYFAWTRILCIIFP